MDFYITPDKRQDCEKALDRMFKHFEVKPTIEYSPVQKVTKMTITEWHGDGDSGVSTTRSILDAIKVTIEDIQKGEWRLVANVNYSDGIMELVDSKMFKNIPEGFGLEYTKCDYCGGKHSNRKMSHILYNTVNGSWKQVGSSCVNKMIAGGKYLSNLMVKLTEVFIIKFGGCDDMMWEGGSWMPADRYWNKAISIKMAITLAKKYWNEESQVWKKAEYNRFGEKEVDGTADKLKYYVAELINKTEVNEEYFSSVAEYVDSLEGGYDSWNNEPTFNQKIKNAFENEWISVGEMFLAFFTVKGYESSIHSSEFAKEVEALGIVKGEKYLFSGKLVEVEKLEPDYDCYNPYDWMNRTTWLFTLKDDATGILFEKEVANKSVMDAFKSEDDTYKFKGTVKYIAFKKQRVVFGGRLSKAR